MKGLIETDQTFLHLQRDLVSQNPHGDGLAVCCRPAGHDLPGVLLAAIKLGSL